MFREKKMLTVILNARIKNADSDGDIELNYDYLELHCFQLIPRRAIAYHTIQGGYLYLRLEEYFSIEINTGPTAIAFNEIQFKHLTDSSLNFELPMGLVKRIYDFDRNIDFCFRLP